MSDTKFTPGPWNYDWSHEAWNISVPVLYINQKEGAPYAQWSSDIATVNLNSQTKEIAEANAHLISAAPDMYKALEEILEYFPVGSACVDEQDESIHKARITLEKARGEI